MALKEEFDAFLPGFLEMQRKKKEAAAKKAASMKAKPLPSGYRKQRCRTCHGTGRIYQNTAGDGPMRELDCGQCGGKGRISVPVYD